jgi:tellurite resistance protein TerC
VLLIDLGVFSRTSHEVKYREAIARYAVWVCLSMLFAAGIWWFSGTTRAVHFITGYVIEVSLSADNIFVFVSIFAFFAVPKAYQQRVLLWGILGAIVMRGAMIITGTALVQRFEWITYILGGFLVVTGLKMAFKGDSEFHPEKNIMIRIVSKVLPVTKGYEGQAFFVKRNRMLMATPLLLVLLVVETADIVFAIDSIPAIFAVTTDTFIVYTSNIFAILGLRSLYFILAGAMDRFRYLGPSLAAVLIFVGLKMLVQHWYKLNVFLSLGIIVGLLGLGIAASFIAAGRDRARAKREGASGGTHDS